MLHYRLNSNSNPNCIVATGSGHYKYYLGLSINPCASAVLSSTSNGLPVYTLCIMKVGKLVFLFHLLILLPYTTLWIIWNILSALIYPYADNLHRILHLLQTCYIYFHCITRFCYTFVCNR